MNVADPAGHVLTTGNDPQTVTVTSGTPVTAAPVGFQAQGTVQGHTFVDTNGNGVQDGGKGAVATGAGVTVSVPHERRGHPDDHRTDHGGRLHLVGRPPLAPWRSTSPTPPATRCTTGNDPQNLTVFTGAVTTAGAIGYQPPGVRCRVMCSSTSTGTARRPGWSPPCRWVPWSR